MPSSYTLRTASNGFKAMVRSVICRTPELRPASCRGTVDITLCEAQEQNRSVNLIGLYENIAIRLLNPIRQNVQCVSARNLDV